MSACKSGGAGWRVWTLWRGARFHGPWRSIGICLLALSGKTAKSRLAMVLSGGRPDSLISRSILRRLRGG